MAKAKTEGAKKAAVELKKDPSRALNRASLRKSFPFLVHKFRTVKESELGSEKAFKDLFPDEDFASHKLYRINAIYEYQK